MEALIADDEPPARRRVRSLLAREPDIRVVGEAGDGLEAIRLIDELEPDLLFLDVQMPEVDGFGVLKALPAERMPVVVFTTAYDEFALEAFQVHALDYLLKPFDAERFQQAVRRAREHFRRGATDVDPRLLSLLAELKPRGPFLERLSVKSRGRIHVLPVQEIDWIEAETNYVRLHVGDRSYLLRATMNAMEEQLDPAHFLRIGRSRIVNLQRVKELEPLFQGEYVLYLHDGTRLVSGRSYRSRVREALRLP